jgi:N-hydroxyarylamine O-acetyltransferase
MRQKVNLNAYFERIGFAGSIAPSLATLEQLHALHPAAIAFENLNPLLGLPVRLDLGSLQAKLLTERRGGYCYEHNLLLKAMLEELEFSVRGLAARVLWNNPGNVDGPAHHMLLAVDISSTTYIADVGFGGLTLTGPLRLKADAEQSTPHGRFRLTGGDPVWRLEAWLGEDWAPLYAFDLSEKTEADYEVSNSFLSTDPTSPFRNQLRVALAPAGKRLALKDNQFTSYGEDGQAERRELTSVAEMREVLTTSFGIALPTDAALDAKFGEILLAAGIAPPLPDVAPEGTAD